MVKYYTAQPWYKKKDISFLYEPQQHLMRDLDVISWRSDKQFHYIEDNLIYIGLTSNTARNPSYDPAIDDYLTTQVQHTYAAPIRFWQQNNTLEMGAMIKMTSHGGDGIAYGNFYTRWTDTTSMKSIWWQSNYFDERGTVNNDSIYVDTFTGQIALASDMGDSVFSFNLPDSNTIATEAWQDFRFYGVGQTQSQFDTLLDAMNAAGANISSNPNDYVITAAGLAPEIAYADSPSWIMQWTSNFFVRGE
jgi:hypothetical protein